MAKKKSKTQKYKKNLKKKQAKALEKNLTNTKEIKTTEPKKLVPVDKVDYNVVINNKKKPGKTVENKTDNNKNVKKATKKQVKVPSTPSKQKPKKPVKQVPKKTTTKVVGPVKQVPKKIEHPKKDDKKSFKFSELTFVKKINKKINEFKLKQKVKKNKEITNNKIDLPKLKKKETPKVDKKNKNIFIRLLYEIKNNIHIIFNTIIIVTFLIMLIGLIRIHTLSKGTIIYISCIFIFLMLVAISYNKYMSGKVFTIILSLCMGAAIYHMQYTYDFIRNLNSNEYEYKTYYVVTFDNGLNKSVYNINNKKVGLLKDNSVNIERKLNTKLKVKYIEYDDINKLYKDFYNQEYRAILVNENQYRYMENNIENNRKVKILYEFQVNAKK